MNKLVGLVLVALLAAGGYFAWTWVQGISQKNEFVEYTKVRFAQQVREIGHYPSEAEVEDIARSWLGSHAGIEPRGDGAVEVEIIPVEVTADCKMKEPPKAFAKLSTLDKGNVRNLAVRCKAPLALVGLKLDVQTSSGRPFQVERWTYAQGD